MSKEILERIKIENGKPAYVLCVVEGDSKLMVYIKHGSIYFESNDYGFRNYTVFSMVDESHEIAKEMFLSSLKTDVKNKILELKQLEVILDSLGLAGAIREELGTTSKRLSFADKVKSLIGSVD